MIKRVVKEIVGRFGLELRRTQFPRFNTLGFYGIPYDEWEFQQKRYYLKVLNITVEDTSSPLICGYQLAKRIKTNGGGQFSFDDAGNLLLAIHGISFYINFTDELFVIHEVFVSGEYNFKTSDEFIVIDIGLNIGATALFFSQQKNVKHVYAYELFEPTYREALRNIALNDTSKITSKNVGIGRESKLLHIPYSITSKATMSLNGAVAGQFPDAKTVEVHLIDVAEEFRRIDNLEFGAKKICKMDCEGAEFEILERLFETNLIGTVDFYIIEWHNKDTDNIERKFLENGYEITKSTFEDGQTGLIHAYKCKTS
jgi:FkbM family methyltransferase